MKTLLLLVLLCPLLTAAQTRTYKGRIEGPAGERVSFATVILLRGGLQTAGTTADSLGRFSFAAQPGEYDLQVRHLAYRTLERPLTLTGTDDPEPIRLQEAATTVEEVVVEAVAVERLADRFVMTVGDATPLAGKDATELLRQAPGVWLDDNGVAINGAKGTKVFVDEREQHLDADKTADYLRTLSAADIARIEVIPQAGAEYAADARGGVVRIVLRRRRSNGMNGSLTLATSQGGRIANYAPSATLAAHAGRWTLNGAVSGLFTPRGEGRYDESRAYPSDAVHFAGVSRLDSRSDFGTFRLGAFYDLTPRHTIGAEAEYAVGDSRVPSTAKTAVTRQGTETAATSRYRQTGDEGTLSAAFNYVWKIDTAGSAFKVLMDYTRRRSTGDNGYFTQFDSGARHRDTAYRSATAARYDILSAETALDRRYGQGLTLRAGMKYTRNRMDDDALYEGKTADGWQTRPAYSHVLAYTEQIGAAYLTLGADVGGWNLSAGLRGEYTGTEGRGGEVHKSYFDLFPHASATVALNGIRTWMLAMQYSRNISRPAFRSLNPARIQFSDYNYQIGNPALRPTYIHRASLTAIWRYRYTLTVGCNLHHDLIREVSRLDADHPDVSYIVPENHHTENHWFVALNAPVKLRRGWTLTVSAVGVKQDIRLERNGPLAEHYLLFANATTGVELPGKFYAELSYSGHTRLYSGNSEVEGRHTLGAALKKRLCRDRLVVSLAVENITGANEAYVSRTESFTRRMTGYSPWSTRRCKLSLTWNFRSGSEFKTRKIESAAAGERSRLRENNGQSK